MDTATALVSFGTLVVLWLVCNAQMARRYWPDVQMRFTQCVHGVGLVGPLAGRGRACCRVEARACPARAPAIASPPPHLACPETHAPNPAPTRQVRNC